MFPSVHRYVAGLLVLDSSSIPEPADLKGFTGIKFLYRMVRKANEHESERQKSHVDEKGSSGLNCQNEENIRMNVKSIKRSL